MELGEGRAFKPDGGDVRSRAAEDTVRTFRELWAISLHDGGTRRAVDDLNDELMSGTLHRINPTPNATILPLPTSYI
jgi:hypothetical protein